jgi:hypothetical protein
MYSSIWLFFLPSAGSLMGNLMRPLPLLITLLISAVYQGGPAAIRASDWSPGLYTVIVQDGLGLHHLRAVRE